MVRFELKPLSDEMRQSLTDVFAAAALRHALSEKLNTAAARHVA